jgi:hypothetical protein
MFKLHRLPDARAGGPVSYIQHKLVAPILTWNLTVSAKRSRRTPPSRRHTSTLSTPLSAPPNVLSAVCLRTISAKTALRSPRPCGNIFQVSPSSSHTSRSFPRIPPATRRRLQVKVRLSKAVLPNCRPRERLWSGRSTRPRRSSLRKNLVMFVLRVSWRSTEQKRKSSESFWRGMSEAVSDFRSTGAKAAKSGIDRALRDERVALKHGSEG